MTEAYLHYIWQNRLFDIQNLKSTGGESIQIINIGFHNVNAGPDFLEARIKIGDKEWAGHVEIHVIASDWDQHAHQFDEGYDNVILHVVYEEDRQIKTSKGMHLPALELKGRFDEMGYWRYEQFISNKQLIPCAPQLKEVDPFIKSSVLERRLVDRLEDKSSFILDIHEQTKGDWSATFYRALFYAFGLKVNALSMLTLAERIPEKILMKHQNNPFQIEALVFGASGLLEGEDEYVQKLSSEFEFLRKKYSIMPMKRSEWKFARMRPAGFPTVRIAQLVEVLKRHQNIFRLIIEIEQVTDFRQILQHDLPDYWTMHYRFGHESNSIGKTVSNRFVDVILINAIIPISYNYGRILSKPELQDRALNWLSDLKAENNSTVNRMREIGFSIQSAYESQGALQLYKGHCRLRKCLSCAIGVKLLKQ